MPNAQINQRRAATMFSLTSSTRRLSIGLNAKLDEVSMKNLPQRNVLADNTISFEDKKLHINGANPGDIIEVIVYPAIHQAHAWQYPSTNEEHKCTFASPVLPRSLCHIDHATHTSKH